MVKIFFFFSFSDSHFSFLIIGTQVPLFQRQFSFSPICVKMKALVYVVNLILTGTPNIMFIILSISVFSILGSALVE